MTKATVHPFLMGLLRGTDVEALAPSSMNAQAWEQIITDATQQGLVPILYRWLTTSNSSHKFSPLILDEIKQRVVSLAARNMVLAQELASILRACEARGVACAPLRGLALAELLYGDTTRPMGDLDLLVRKDELDRVADTLMRLGFEEVDHRPGFARSFSYTLEFFKDRHGCVIVEPHWTIAYPPFVDRVDMELVWKRCERGRVVGVDTWLLAPEDLLLHLCFHLIHGGKCAPLLWFYELDRLLRQEQATLDWPLVVVLARETGLALFLAEVLGKVKSLFDSPVPDEILSQLHAPLMPHLARVVRRSVESRITLLLVRGSHVDGREEFALLFSIKGLRAKFRYAFALLFPSPEFMLYRYRVSTRKQLGLCYITRLVHLSWEGLKWVAGLLVSSRRHPQSPPRWRNAGRWSREA